VTIPEADDLINEVYGQYLPEDKKRKPDQKKGFAAANVKLNTETGTSTEPFVSFLQHCIGLATPKMRRDEKEMENWKNFCRFEETHTAAFYDKEAKDITVRTDREYPATMLHEVMHAYADTTVDDKLSRFAKEGLTEYLTRQVIYKHKTKKDEKPLAISQSYGGPYDALVELSLVVGEAALAKAHFQGEIKPLCEALGKPVFDKWLEAMESLDGWQEAVKLTRQRKPSLKGKRQEDGPDKCD
jgi:hypothetical protein